MSPFPSLFVPSSSFSFLSWSLERAFMERIPHGADVSRASSASHNFGNICFGNLCLYIARGDLLASVQ